MYSRKLIAIALATACLLATACNDSTPAAGGGGSGGGGGTATAAPGATTAPTAAPTAAPTTNIVGQIFATASSYEEMAGQGRIVKMGYGHVRQVAQSGCTVTVYDITGSTSLATGTSDSTGAFAITSGSLTAGTSYKVVSTCAGSKSFTAIIGADNTPPANKTPEVVDSKATLIAVEIVKAIVTAVNSAVASLTSLPASVATAITATLLSPDNISKVVSSVSSTIQSAIDNGAMTPPSDTASASMTTAVAAVTTSSSGTASGSTSSTAVTAALTSLTTAETAYTSDTTTSASTGQVNTIPASVSTAVKGAAATVAAFPACDSSLASSGAASLLLCTQAVAKMMYNVLHFDIAVLKTGGAFGTITTCSTDTTLAAAFPNANISAGLGTGFNATTTDSAFCMVHSSAGSVDRNASYSSSPGGKNGGGNPIFVESGGTVTNGVITALATALYNKYNYHLSDLDSMVFGYSATNGGMNVRLLYTTNTFSWASYTGNGSAYTSNYYPLTTSAGVTDTDTTLTWPTCYSSPCNPGDPSMFGFSGADWSTAATNTAIATEIKAGYPYSTSVLFDKYGGTIPNAVQLKAQLVNAKTHQDFNITGQPTFQVVYSKQPNWQDPNCQWNSTGTVTNWTPPSGTGGVASPTPTTACLAMDGTASPAVTVNAVTGTSDTTTGLSQITQIYVPKTGTGQYYLFPQYGSNGKFSGLVQLISANNGRVMVDEMFNQRWVQIILDTTTQCGGSTGIPSTCAQGDMYNVSVAWTCTSGGPCTAATTPTSTTAINSTAIASSIGTSYLMSVTYQPYMSPSTNGPGNIGINVTSGNSMSIQPLALTPNSAGKITAAVALSGSSASLPTGTYHIQPFMMCTGCSPGVPCTCTSNGYYLTSATGAPYTNSGTLDTGLTVYPTATPNASPGSWSAPTSPCSMGGGGGGGGGGGAPSCPSKVVKYTDTYLNGLGATVFPTGTGSNKDTWKNVAEQIQIYNGPAANPTYDCSLDPYYLDANGNGKLDYTVNATTGAVTCTETTFNNPWNIASFVSGGVMMNPMASPSPTPTTAVLATITANNNTYVYSDPSSAMALMNTAFGAWMDGTHSLSASTNLNGLQVFGLLYMFMTGNSTQQIEGLLANANGKVRDQFVMAGPMFSGSMTLTSINSAIGLSILNNKQP